MDSDLTAFGPTHFGQAELGDRRRTGRLVRVADKIAAHPAGSLPDKMGCPADLLALYRLMNRPEVTHAAVLETHLSRTRSAIRAHQGVVLIGHDDTELDFSGKRSLRQQLGPLGGKNQHGYLCHNSLAVGADGEPLGLANQILHKRRRRKKKTSRAVCREDPLRETRLWVRGREAIGDFSAKEEPVVDLVDRGGDTFEFLDYEHAHGYHYVARSKPNRSCWIGHQECGQEVLLHDHLSTLQAVDGGRVVEVAVRQASHGRPHRPARQATVVMAFCAVTLIPPSPGQARGEHRQVPLRVWALRAWEPSPPEGEEALEWFLITDVAVETAEDGWERVDWYERRWPICEEYHKGQKTGCRIEGPQFTTTAALEPMIALLSVVAWLLMRLRWAARQPEAAERPATDFVPLLWVLLLSKWRHKEQRPNWTLLEFLMALARWGGHQNRKSDGLPGWQTLWKGWTKLRTIADFADLHSG
jgi:Transposase DNA-binding